MLFDLPWVQRHGKNLPIAPYVRGDDGERTRCGPSRSPSTSYRTINRSLRSSAIFVARTDADGHHNARSFAVERRRDRLVRPDRDAAAGAGSGVAFGGGRRHRTPDVVASA